MTTLHHAHCEACRADAPHVPEETLLTLLREVPAWQLATRDGHRELVRVFRFKNFSEALTFTNAVGELAEAEGHHPALLTEWGSVTVTWWTHAIDGLHRNDFIMCARTDRLAEATPGATPSS